MHRMWIVKQSIGNVSSFISFLQSYTPTSFDKTVSELLVDNQRVSFVIWDTSGNK